MGAKLTVVAGPSRGAEFALAGRIIFNIGSDRGSSVFLDDARVATNHCRLYNEESKFTLFDVSGKGMDVNGKRVVKAVLHDGDVISLGDTRLCFSTSGGEAVSAPGGGFAPVGAAPMGAPPMGAAPMGAGSPGDDFQLDLGSGLPGAPRSTGYARVWLKCVEGNDKGKTFDLSEGTCWVLGRGHSADITVMDIKVSRAHTRIDRQGDAFFVSDLNSTNGSFVNGQQIERQQLQRGDYVKLGYTILSFQYETLEETGGQSGQILDPAAMAGLHDDPFSRELGSVSGGMRPPPAAPPAAPHAAPHAGAGLPTAPPGAGPPPLAPAFAGGPPPLGGAAAAAPPGFPPPGGDPGRFPQAPPGAAPPPPFPPPGAGGAPPFPPPGAGGAPPFPPPGAGGAPPFPPPGGVAPGGGGLPPAPGPGGPPAPPVAGGEASAAPRPIGRTAPGMPSAGDFEDMQLDVSALDDADNLFAPASAGSGSFPPPGSGALPAPGSGAFPPPGSGGFPPPGSGALPTPGSGAFPPPGSGGFPPPGSGGFPPPGSGGSPPPGSGAFPPPGSGSSPPPGSGSSPPPGAQASPPGIPGVGGPPGAPAVPRAHLQTRDLAVPDMDDDLFGAPSPAGASAPAADVQCFLCNRTFGAAEVAAGRVRKVQENYYCQGCLGSG